MVIKIIARFLLPWATLHILLCIAENKSEGYISSDDVTAIARCPPMSTLPFFFANQTPILCGVQSALLPMLSFLNSFALGWQGKSDQGGKVKDI